MEQETSILHYTESKDILHSTSKKELTEFCKNFEKTTESFIIGNKPKIKPTMSTAKVITIYYL